MTKFIFVSAGLAVTGLASPANLLIDDFSNGPYSVTLTTPASMDTAFQNASVLGGIRTTRLFVESNPLLTNVTLSVGGGFGVVDSGTLADNWCRVGYGYKNNGSGGLAVNPLNQNLTGYNAFKIDFLSNDLPNDLKVYVGTMVGSVLNLSTATVTVPANPNVSFSQVVNFGSFSGTANFADADVIVFEFDNTPSGDFAIGKLQAVPEPATMAALGLGVAALLRRRRKA